MAVHITVDGPTSQPRFFRRQVVCVLHKPHDMLTRTDFFFRTKGTPLHRPKTKRVRAEAVHSTAYRVIWTRLHQSSKTWRYVRSGTRFPQALSPRVRRNAQNKINILPPCPPLPHSLPTLLHSTLTVILHLPLRFCTTTLLPHFTRFKSTSNKRSSATTAKLLLI